MAAFEFTLFDLIHNPYAIYKKMRECGPIYWDPKYKCWFVTDYEIAKTLLKDARVSSDISPYLYETTFPVKSREKIQPLMDLFASWLVFSDPPYHTELRKILNPFFGSAALKMMEPKIKKHTVDLLGACGDDWDVTKQFSAPLTTTIITELMEMPNADADQLVQWNDVIGEFMESVVRTPEITEPALQALREQKHYLLDFIEKGLQSNKPNFVKSLHEGLQQQEKIKPDAYWHLLSMLLGAGSETTKNMIGNGLLALLQHPEQFNALKNDPSLIETAVDELLRYDTSVQSMIRHVKGTIEMGDVTIEAGQYVRIFIGAVNRNETYFEDADRFDIRRLPNKHLSFGAGIHFCIGQALARLTLRICIPAILKRFPNLKLATQALEWTGGVTLRGLKSLNVRDET